MALAVNGSVRFEQVPEIEKPNRPAFRSANLPTALQNVASGTHAIAHIDVDLETKGILDAMDPEGSLERKKEQLRRMVFREVVEQMIPKMMQSTGAAVEPPKTGDIQAEVSTDGQLLAPEIVDGTLNTRNQFQIVMDLKSALALDPYTALYMNRGGIACEVTDNVMFALENRYLAKERSTVQTHYSLEGDRVIAYQATEIAAAGHRPLR